MDVTQNTYNHHENILDDKMYTVILAWIEKSGKISEEEIISEVAVDRNRLKTIVLKLYKNQLIEIMGENLRVTPSGKAIVDALGLSEYLIHNSMVHHGLDDIEQQFINQSLTWYRNHYYDNYLSTNSDIRLWLSIENTVGKKRAMTFNGYLTIFLFDLIEVLLVNSVPHRKITLGNIINSIGSKSKVSSLDNTGKAFKKLNRFFGIDSDEKLESLPNSEREIFTFLQCKNYWVNESTFQKEENIRLFSEFAKETKLSQYYFLNNRLSSKSWSDKLPDNSIVDHLYPRSKKTKENSVLDQFAFVMENAGSLEMVSSIFERPADETLAILKKIKINIKMLIKTHN